MQQVRDDSSRRIIVSERGNFPTDLYIAQGLNALLGNCFTLKLVDADEIEDSLDSDVAVALITQVDYCSGHLHDMKKLNAAAAKAGTPPA